MSGTGRSIGAVAWLVRSGLVCASVGVFAAAAGAQRIRLDVSPGGAPGDALAALPVVSFDGRYSAFVSEASNLVPGDTDGATDFFRYDRTTGQLARGDILANFGAFNYPSLTAISADGRWLLFNSLNDDWIAGDTNGAGDVFLYDFSTGAVTRVSVGTGGTQANGASWAVTLSADGRYVVFDSSATNLAPAAVDNGDVLDVFVHDRQTGETTQISRGFAGGPANGDCSGGRISPDGGWVIFSSRATNLTGEPDTNGQGDAFVVPWRTGPVQRIAPLGVEPDRSTVATSVSWNAAVVVLRSEATNLVPGLTRESHAYVWDRLGRSVRVLPPSFGTTPMLDDSQPDLSLYGRYALRGPLLSGNGRVLLLDDLTSGQVTKIADGIDGQFGLSLDGRWAVFTHTDGVFLQALAGPSEGLIPSGDADADGLPNGWEAQFGLDAEAAAGADGGDGDPDLDSVTNRDELAAGTHPRGTATRHLAEGAQNAFFDTRIALLNPRGSPAHVQVRFLRADAGPVVETLEIPAFMRRTIVTRGLDGLAGSSFATVVEADAPIVVDRTMLWDRTAYGGHAETSAAAAATTWYFAEGSTAGRFDLFYLLENPNPTIADATITWLQPPPMAPVVHTYALPPRSRTTLYVDAADVRLASADLAAAIVATQPIFAERAMYYSRPELPFAAGHAASGVTAPSPQWFLAEGATGTFFETFVLLLNPAGTAASCDVRYQTTGGAVYTKPYLLPPASRTTIWVDAETLPGVGRALAATAVSTLVSCDVPIVVERAMWWPDGDWYEAHVSAGATATAARWAMADGDAVDTRTFVLVANTSPTAGDARVTLFFEAGPAAQRLVPVAAASRTTLDLTALFPGSAGRRFGVVVEAIGEPPPALVVERATYWNAEGVLWTGGTNALATPVP
jgi:hypothetical protein